jgi:MFS family permease
VKPITVLKPDKKRKMTYFSLWGLYFMIYFLVGIIPVNIDNLSTYLPGTTNFGIGIVVALSLFISSISIILFGYIGGKFSKKFPRKKVFIITNLIWICAYCLTSISPNYLVFGVSISLAAFGTGAFIPIAFSIISDFYIDSDRGKKYGMMQFGLMLGSGMGIILGGLLGSYTGPLGWRFAYGIGFILSLLNLINYVINGIDPKQGSAELKFNIDDAELLYNYEISIANLKNLFKKKSVISILFYVLSQGITSATLGTWAIFYLTIKISGGEDPGLFATTLYLLAGIGTLPGTIIGGRIGDSFVKRGKLKGRVIISLFGSLFGMIFLFGFYLIPFFTASITEIVLSWIFFISIGFLANFLINLCQGNIYAVYSEVNVPELRSTANSLNGLMVNFGAIIGNLILSSLIENNLSLLPFAISIVLFVQLFGSAFWIITYFYYPKEFNDLREIMNARQNEIEQKLS